ncbi:MAG: hypothetical protein JWR84_1285 [Caulobacter sp.]|nr:hypothetical protein [Caulobacter sp.]
MKPRKLLAWLRAALSRLRPRAHDITKDKADIRRSVRLSRHLMRDIGADDG